MNKTITRNYFASVEDIEVVDAEFGEIEHVVTTEKLLKENPTKKNRRIGKILNFRF
jgi:hypothetical protein